MMVWVLSDPETGIVCGVYSDEGKAWDAVKSLYDLTPDDATFADFVMPYPLDVTAVNPFGGK